MNITKIDINKCYYKYFHTYEPEKGECVNPEYFFKILLMDGQGLPDAEDFINIIAMCNICVNEKRFTWRLAPAADRRHSGIQVNGIQILKEATDVLSVIEITKEEAINLDALHTVMNG